MLFHIRLLHGILARTTEHSALPPKLFHWVSSQIGFGTASFDALVRGYEEIVPFLVVIWRFPPPSGAYEHELAATLHDTLRQ